jgi:hypothetical protein
MAEVNPRLFKPADAVINKWGYRAPCGTKIEQLLDQYYWSHISSQLNDGDHIEVYAEGGDYWLDLLVIEHDKKFAKVFPLRREEFTMAQLVNVSVPEGYEIKLRGPRKWSVLRGTEVLKDDMSKAQAEQWLTDHVKATPKAA